MKMKVVMPQLGESIPEGEIIGWRRDMGQAVERDEPLVVVKTDKAEVEIPAPASGRLEEILAGPGEVVPVGTPIAVIEVESEMAATSVEMPAPQPRLAEPVVPLEPMPAPLPEAREARRAAEAPAPPSVPPAYAGPAVARAAAGTGAGIPTAEPPAAPTPPVGRPPRKVVRMTPLARAMAKELGLDPAAITGTGAMGRITREDVLLAAEKRKAALETQEKAPPPSASRPEAPPESAGPAPAPEPPPEVHLAPVAGEDEAVPLSPMRRRIAARLQFSRQTIADVTTVVEVDLTAVDGLRERHKAEYERRGAKLTYMPFILRATAEALRAFPYLNASWGGDKIILHKRIHLGVAVSVEGGLTVPVIRDADALSVRALTERLAQVAVRARGGKLAADEIQGGTFTITNPGMFGTVFSTPIINPPDAAILGVGRVADTPAVRDKKIVIRRMAYLFLSYDHRIVDGETAIRFLQHIRSRLEAADFDLA